MTLTGLWDGWRSPGGMWVKSYAVITVEPDPVVAEVHDRMPAILPPEHWPAWLGETPATEAELKSMLRALFRVRPDGVEACPTPRPRHKQPRSSRCTPPGAGRMKHRRGPFSEDIRMARGEADPELMLYRVRARRERVTAEARAQGLTEEEIGQLLAQGIDAAERRIYGDEEAR